jgi:EAL and modified HD-GYP domain-containing signal transduction protein
VFTPQRAQRAKAESRDVPPGIATMPVVSQPCVARQPILDLNGRVFGYELLFRRSAELRSCDVEPNLACMQVVVDAMHSIGLDTLTTGKFAFVNITREFLLSGSVTLLPRERVVIELLEEIEADREVVDACAALKHAGYALALDDFTNSDHVAPLLPLVEYLKIDVLALNSRAAREPVLAAATRYRPCLVAEKVETPERFDDTAAEGFTHFQGYFFGRPAVREVKRIPTSRAAYAALLAQLSNPDISVRELERVIKQDVSLTHRVLRAVNSAATPLRVEIRSIDQAIILLGRDTIRRWGALWAIASINNDACPELINSSIIRARCCELLEARAGRESGAGFLLGICSLLDAILEQPMAAVLQQLPVQADIRAALLGESNPRRTLLDCVVAYERGDWHRSETLAAEARVNAAVLPDYYQDSLGWARAITSSR